VRTAATNATAATSARTGTETPAEPTAAGATPMTSRCLFPDPIGVSYLPDRRGSSKPGGDCFYSNG
jgi:hypothetical protein